MIYTIHSNFPAFMYKSGKKEVIEETDLMDRVGGIHKNEKH
jgi:hypothetical protein